MEFLDKVSEYLTPGTAIMTALGLAFEFGFRLFKSEKPLSFAHAFASGARKFGEFSTKLAEFLDRVLPQRTK